MLWTAPFISWWSIFPTMKGDDLKLPLGHPAFASWQAPVFPCSEVILSLGSSKERRWWCSSFVQRMKLWDFPLVYGEMQVNTCKASTQTLINEMVPINTTAANNLFLIIHSFFWLKATWMLKCLYSTRLKSSSAFPTHPKQPGALEPQSLFRISLSPSTHFIPKLYLHFTPPLLMTYCSANCPQASFAPHLTTTSAFSASKGLS